jgi:hypothetical protein
MPEGHADPRVLDRRTCVLRYLIDDFAALQPDAIYAVFEVESDVAANPDVREASDWTSLTPPTPSAASETAETDAATFDSDSELRVAVTTISARPSVGGAASCAMAGAAMSATPDRSRFSAARCVTLRRCSGDVMRIAPNAENCLRTMFSPLVAAAWTACSFIYWCVDT